MSINSRGLKGIPPHQLIEKFIYLYRFYTKALKHA